MSEAILFEPESQKKITEFNKKTSVSLEEFYKHLKFLHLAYSDMEEYLKFLPESYEKTRISKDLKKLWENYNSYLKTYDAKILDIKTGKAIFKTENDFSKMSMDIKILNEDELFPKKLSEKQTEKEAKMEEKELVKICRNKNQCASYGIKKELEHSKDGSASGDKFCRFCGMSNIIAEK